MSEPRRAERSTPPPPAHARPDALERRTRRREARRRTRLARVDLALGVVAALLVLVLSPGLAITGLLALIVLAALGISIVVGRRRARARRAPSSAAARAAERRTARLARERPSAARSRERA